MITEDLIKALQNCPLGLPVMYKDLGTDQQPAYTEATELFVYNDGEVTFIALK